MPAPILVALDPLPFAEAAHAHRIGLAGPWLSWSTTTGSPALGVLAAHHLVLEGPNFARVRTDFRRRVRALRTALGLDATEPDDELFGPFDSAPFRRREPFPMGSVADHVGVAQEFAPWEPTLPAIDEARRATYAFDPGQPEPEAEPELPDSLRAVRNRRPPAWLGPLQLPGYRGAPSLRYATVERGAFSLPAFSYAFCRAQHEALALHDPRYTGGGFTFIVPHRSGAAAQRGSRGQPVLCAFRTFDGEAEGIAAFAARMQRQLDAAEQGEDLLSRVLDDALRLAVPDALKAAAVLALERFPGDGGSFLGGRGLVSRIELDDELVDPVARYAGLHDGVFGGSCQERGGVSLTAIDRGERRDLGAVGTGVFRRKQAMDLFWQRFAWYLGG